MLRGGYYEGGLLATDHATDTHKGRSQLTETWRQAPPGFDPPADSPPNEAGDPSSRYTPGTPLGVRGALLGDRSQAGAPGYDRDRAWEGVLRGMGRPRLAEGSGGIPWQCWRGFRDGQALGTGLHHWKSTAGPAPSSLGHPAGRSLDGSGSAARGTQDTRKEEEEDRRQHGRGRARGRARGLGDEAVRGRHCGGSTARLFNGGRGAGWRRAAACTGGWVGKHLCL